MKKMILINGVLIVFSITASGAPMCVDLFKRSTVTELTPEVAQIKVEASNLYKEIEKLNTNGGDILKDPVLKSRLSAAIEATLKDVIPVSQIEIDNACILIQASPLKMMTELSRLASIVKSNNSFNGDARIAGKSIELLLMSAPSMPRQAVNKMAEKMIQAEIQESFILAKELATIDVMSDLNPFMYQVEAALKQKQSLSEAVTQACLKSEEPQIKSLHERHIQRRSTLAKDLIKPLLSSSRDFAALSPNEQMKVINDYSAFVTALSSTKFSVKAVQAGLLWDPFGDLSDFLKPSKNSNVQWAISQTMINYARVTTEMYSNGLKKMLSATMSNVYDNAAIDVHIREAMFKELILAKYPPLKGEKFKTNEEMKAEQSLEKETRVKKQEQLIETFKHLGTATEKVFNGLSLAQYARKNGYTKLTTVPNSNFRRDWNLITKPWYIKSLVGYNVIVKYRPDAKAVDIMGVVTKEASTGITVRTQDGQTIDLHQYGAASQADANFLEIYVRPKSSGQRLLNWFTP